jgi:hypothetical protein
LLRSPKARQTSHKNERMLCFRLDPSADIGVSLVEASPTVPRLDPLCPTLVVRSVEANSPFARDVDGMPGVLPGDVLLEVNGCRGSPEELRDAFRQVELCNDEKLITLTVRPRPVSFNVNLRFNSLPLGEKLGITVVIDKTHPRCVRVKAVHDQGLVASWNASHPLLCVCSGDLIAGVNDIAGDAHAMRQEIEAQTKCQRGSLLFHISTKTRRGQTKCPPRVSGVSPPWRELLPTPSAGGNENESDNARNIQNSFPPPTQSSSGKLSL